MRLCVADIGSIGNSAFPPALRATALGRSLAAADGRLVDKLAEVHAALVAPLAAAAAATGALAALAHAEVGVEEDGPGAGAWELFMNQHTEVTMTAARRQTTVGRCRLTPG